MTFLKKSIIILLENKKGIELWEKIYLVNFMNESEYKVFTTHEKALEFFIKKYVRFCETQYIEFDSEQFMEDIKDLINEDYIEDFGSIFELVLNEEED